MKQKEFFQRNILEDEKSEDDPEEVEFVDERKREAKDFYKSVKAVREKLT